MARAELANTNDENPMMMGLNRAKRGEVFSLEFKLRPHPTTWADPIGMRDPPAGSAGMLLEPGGMNCSFEL